MPKKNTEDDILKKILVGTEHECWPWLGGLNHKGYGISYWNGFKPAHRAAYMIFVGPVPKGLYVCHKCDNRCCCNPHHLFIGTQDDNMKDMVAKGRSNHPIGVRNGRAKLTPEQVVQIRQQAQNGTKATELGKVFGVTPTTIRNIVIGKLWPSIQEGLV